MTDQSPTESRSSAADAVVTSARADLEAGREWKARDVLVGHVAGTYDPEALALLGDVHAAMRDLPSAGAAWFGTNRRGADVDAAVDAWRDRHADNFVQMWHSLPQSVRDHEGNKRVDALRRRVEKDQPAAGLDAAEGDSEGGVDTAVIIAVAVGILFVICAVIGFVTLLSWLVPGV
ncbi:hypothetical protein [Phycicoccus sp. Root563]|uniref:hypothetical protein n=1 Tax=Phycicoccus sp. Root563 TaxID=1736562 RepID=UPI0012F9BD85|nr:hypothetical protein [Phycicoccus sp. Root563]